MKKKLVRILLVEDEEAHAKLVQRSFAAKDLNVSLTVVGTLREARGCLAESPPDLLMTDLFLPDGPGMDLLLGHEEGGGFPAILMTSFGNEQAAVDAMKAGALDYVVKSETTLADMPHIAQRALERWEDIVQRRLAEDALRESEEKFRGMAERNFDTLFIADRQGVFTYVSPAEERLLGYEPEEVTGKHFTHFLVESETARIQQRFAEALQGDFKDILEMEARRKDGSPAFLEVGHTRILEHGEVVGMQGVIRDVTDRKRMERALEEKTILLDNILRSATDFAIATTDLDFRITYYNPIAEKLFGHSAEEVIGKTAYEMHTRRNIASERFDRAIQAVQRTGEYRFSVLQETDDGPRHLEARIAGILGPDGKTVGYALFGHDVTQRKRSEAALAEAKEAAEAANRAKSEFLANMSHEIRTPMTAVLGYAGLLTDPSISHNERRGHVQTILRNGGILLDLINDILDLSKIESGKMVLEQTDCSTLQIVEEVAGLMRGKAADKGLELRIDYTFPLPETIRTDPTRLHQILVNLVGNAVKFTERGEVRMTVRCMMKGSSPRMEMVVEDTGIGVSPDDMAKLFSPFTQADASTTRRFGGTGLGLTISRRLAEKLGGDIRVQSEVGNGTTFTLTIDPGPLDEVTMLDELPGVVTTERESVDSSSQQRFQGRVLLAEDARDVRRLVRFTLQRLGLEVDTAENGRIAFQKAIASAADGETPYGLVLMDIQMPEMDGHEVTRRLRENGWRGPIVALTAHAMTGDREKCLESGCDDYIPKPIDHNLLVGTLARFLPHTDIAEKDAEIPGGPLISTIVDHPIMADLLEGFVEELPVRAKKIDAALTRGDIDDLRHLAHQLNGAAGIYGFAPIADWASKISDQISGGEDLQQVRQTVAELVDFCNRATDKRGPEATVSPG